MKQEKNRKKLRIIFVSHAPRLEGAERSLLQLVETLYGQGKIEPLVIVPRKGVLESALINKSIPYIRANRYPWWVDRTKNRRLILGPIKWVCNLLSWYLIKTSVKAFNPDLVYINTLVAPFGSIIAKDMNIPMIWHAREFIPSWLDSDYDFGRRWSLSRVAKSAAVIGNSKAVINDIAEFIPESKMYVVYNGITLEEFNKDVVDEKVKLLASRNKKPLKLLIVGSVNSNKDQRTAIKAVARLKEKNIASVLTLVGESKLGYEKELKALSVKLGVFNQVIYKGWQESARPFYKDSDITLVCSKGEPFGRTIIESMAIGTPVISSNTGGAPEIIEKVDSNLLFQEGDYNALSNVIEKLTTDIMWYKRVIIKGRQVVEDNFESSIYSESIFEIFNQVLSHDR